MAQSNKKQAIGKGIRALLSNIDEELSASSPQEKIHSVDTAVNAVNRIPVDQIVVNPKQPRKDFDEVALKELSDSIAQHDIIQPITVVKIEDGKYQLISGERRWRASKLAGLKDIPAYIRQADDEAQLVLALLENLQRENLNAIEIGLSYKRLMDEANLTQEEVATQMNKERSTVANYLRLLKLPPDIQRAVRDGALSMGHARALLSLAEIDKQLYAFRETKEKQLSVRELEKLVKNLNEPKAPAGKPASGNLPPAYRSIQDRMRSHFSTKVELNRAKNGKGSIVIDFYNDEDLERIMDAMNL